MAVMNASATLSRWWNAAAGSGSPLVSWSSSRSGIGLQGEEGVRRRRPRRWWTAAPARFAVPAAKRLGDARPSPEWSGGRRTCGTATSGAVLSMIRSASSNVTGAPPGLPCAGHRIRCSAAAGDGKWRSEGDDLVGPQRPVGQFVEGEAAGSFGEHVLGDAAGVHAGAAAADVGAVAGAGADHPVEVVIAVGQLLVGHGAADGVADQEHPYLAVAAFGEGTGNLEPVVGAFRAVRRVVEDEKNLAAHRCRPLVLSRPTVAAGAGIGRGRWSRHRGAARHVVGRVGRFATRRRQRRSPGGDLV